MYNYHEKHLVRRATEGRGGIGGKVLLVANTYSASMFLDLSEYASLTREVLLLNDVVEFTTQTKNGFKACHCGISQLLVRSELGSAATLDVLNA